MHYLIALLIVSVAKALVFIQTPTVVIQGRYFELSCGTNSTAEIQHEGTVITNCSNSADSCTSTEPAYDVWFEEGNIVLRTNKSDRSRDNGKWTCVTEQIILDIKVLPSVNINVSSTSINVIKGRYFTLKCATSESIPAVPTTGYTWIKNNQIIKGENSFTYTLSKAETTDEGELKCAANNGLEEVMSSNLVRVVVLYPPIVTANHKIYKIQENSSGNVICSANAKPSAITYKWFGPNNFISDGPTLILTNLRRDEAGHYTCSANNSVGTNTFITIVDVLYGPELTFIPPVTMYNVQENKELSLECSVSSNPRPDSFFWYNPDSVRLLTDILVVPGIKRTQEGTYTCRATTTLNPTSGSAVSLNASKSIYIAVSYLDPVKITTSTLVVDEKSKITVACSTESRPEANMTMVVHDKMILELQNNTLTYAVNEAQCLDTGIYSCQAKNDKALQPFFEESKTIQVLCSPRPDHRENITYTTFANTTDVIILKAFIIAFPPPVFIWHYTTAIDDKNFIKNDETFKISTRKTSTRTFVSILTINITSVDLFNQYTLDVYNEIGSTKMVYSVKESGRISKTNIGLILGGVVSSFIVIIFIVVLMVVLHRRKMKQLKKKREEETRYSDLNVDFRTPERTYDGLQDQSASKEQKNCENKTYVNLENVYNDKTYVNCNPHVSPEDTKDVYVNFNKEAESVYANI